MLTVTTNKSTYAVGEAVQITLTLTNTTSSTQTYNFNTSQRYDIVVQKGGREVWRWSNGQFFLQVLGTLTLQPGESVTYTETWDQTNNNGNQVAAGTYTIVGSITSSNNPQQASTTITIQ
ncbi:hypothetical protein CBW65_23430 [Tumebacillus avium]|uniref:Intracellular proteinase inhibitor BsuPI domain-containing protein n=1 Tax=Tumebacillus avium TaxID=1903704 RepID=A0A1Y0ISQ0_9BACL|nr:BsuPI-related putative proteinase inhibitor [Tumebacillus avium]ARU63638.1 hypothetical protein CBW65_23430 [Tumebacillus avium]